MLLLFFLLSDPRLMQRSSSENHEKNSNKATLNIKPGSSCANSEFCPSCSEPFDNGKKRRLIDSCGHERCYTCMFSKELCSLCTFQGKIFQLWLISKKADIGFYSICKTQQTFVFLFFSYFQSENTRQCSACHASKVPVNTASWLEPQGVRYHFGVFNEYECVG